VQLSYRFQIHPVVVGQACHFQLRIGLPDDAERDFIPAYRTAFASRLGFQPAHAVRDDAHHELTRLLAWLMERRH
jgi:hypothetical protein